MFLKLSDNTSIDLPKYTNVASLVPCSPLLQSSEKKLSKFDIRAIFLFNFIKGRKAAENNEIFGEEMTSLCPVPKWFKIFRSGELSLEDRERSERRSVIDDGQLKTVIEKHPRKTSR